MSANMINLGINEDMVKPILEKQIQAAIMANIGNVDELFEFAIKKALSFKTDEHGNISRYSNDNKYDFLEVLTTDAIRKAATEAIREYVKENQEILKVALKKEMEKKANQSKLVEAFVEAASNSFNYNWAFDAQVSLSKKQD